MEPNNTRKRRRRHRAKKIPNSATSDEPEEVNGSSESAVSQLASTAELQPAIPTSTHFVAPITRKGLPPPLYTATSPEPTPTPAIASLHPFPTDPHDHAETPYAAYADIEPLLFGLALQLRSNKARLRIWDPYFCEGSALRHLGKLGFLRVCNVNEDFYATIAESREPPFDTLVTNPPFSGDHMERFLSYLATLDRPWFALMPQFVAQKRYFHEWKAAAVAVGRELPVYIGPARSAYAFSAPALAADGVSALVPDAAEGRRAVADGVRVFAGKFQCVWFACLGPHRAAVLAWWQRKYAGRPGMSAVLVEDDPLRLPQLVHAKKPAPSERRWRKKLHRVQSKLSKVSERGGGEADVPEQLSGVKRSRAGSHRGEGK